MCGICGFVGDRRTDLLTTMATVMAHRGPDDVGVWFDPEAEVGLGHRRLSIIDLSSSGHQPMPNEDETIWVTYNGEIYNFQELRTDLEARGHRFRSRTDTEVLVHLYEEHGADFVNELNGMFALAIWDTRDRTLLLARDHAGVKPLYYWSDGNRFFFASEIKALLRVPEIPRALDWPRIPEYFTFLWEPGEHTMFVGIRKLEPGHLLIWRAGRLVTRRWFQLEYEPDEHIDEAEWLERVHDTFMRTTLRQMVSDVPLGAFLSGGADSSSIVACMRESFPDREINCYTASWAPEDIAQDQFVDDFPYARRVADHLGVRLNSFVLRPDIVSLIPKMVYHLDEPDADPAVLPSYLIARQARESGTVVLLSGTGGDEVFFGYRSHQAYRQLARLRWLPRGMTLPLLKAASGGAAILLGAQRALPRRLRKFTRGLSRRGLARHLELVDFSSPDARRAIWSQQLVDRVGRAEAAPACFERYLHDYRGRGELNLHSYLLVQTFLAAHNFLYTDKSSMATSIEVRVPFMDLELMRLAARVPERLQIKGGVTKYLLKKAMRRYLPNDVLYRSKTGFGAPLRKWINEDFQPIIAELLSERRLRQRGLFDPSGVWRMLEMNRLGRADHAYLIYALLNLEIWQQTFIDRAGEQVTL